MTEQFRVSSLESDIEEAMNGGTRDIVPLFLAAEILLPSGGPIGDRFEGFIPLLYHRDGIPMLATFTGFDRAQATSDLAPYLLTIRGADLIVRMPEAHGIVVNPGHDIGFELMPDSVSRIKEGLMRS